MRSINSIGDRIGDRAGGAPAGSRDLLLVGALPPPTGGIAAHLFDLGRAAIAAGARVRFADVPPGSSRSADGLRLAGALAVARARGDLVHLHTNGHNAGSWRLAALVAAVAGDALLTVHSGFAPSFIERRARACGAIARRFRRVIGVNRGIVEALRDRAGVDGERLLEAPAWSAASLPPPRPPAGLAAIRARHRVLLAATLAHGREYGAHVLLEAAARIGSSIEGAALVLYGPAARDVALQQAIEAGSKRYPLPPIHCFGDLDRAEALAVVQAADAFLRPTLTDGDAISVREALALGRRTIASDAAPRPEGVRLFPAGDGAALAEAIVAALAEPPPAPAAVDQPDPIERVMQLYADAGVPIERRTSSIAPSRTLPPTEPAPSPSMEPAPALAAVQEVC